MSLRGITGYSFSVRAGVLYLTGQDSRGPALYKVDTITQKIIARRNFPGRVREITARGDFAYLMVGNFIYTLQKSTLKTIRTIMMKINSGPGYLAESDIGLFIPPSGNIAYLTAVRFGKGGGNNEILVMDLTTGKQLKTIMFIGSVEKSEPYSGALIITKFVTDADDNFAVAGFEQPFLMDTHLNEADKVIDIGKISGERIYYMLDLALNKDASRVYGVGQTYKVRDESPRRWDGVIYGLDLKTDSLIGEIKFDLSPDNTGTRVRDDYSLQLSRDGGRLFGMITPPVADFIFICDTETMRLIKTLPRPSKTQQVFLSDDEHSLLAVTEDSKVLRIDLETGSARTLMKLPLKLSKALLAPSVTTH